MIVCKKVKYLLASLLVASFVSLLQGAQNEGTLSRGWSQVSNFGDKIFKHPVAPYAMAPFAAYAGALLSSKISDAGGRAFSHLVSQDRYLAATAVGTGALLGNWVANILPSVIPFEIMRRQRSSLGAEQRQSKVPYLGLALTQALFVGIPLTYYAFKQSPDISGNDLFTKFIGHCAPGLIWQRIMSEIENDEVAPTYTYTQDREMNERVQIFVAQMQDLNRRLQDIEARQEQLNQEYHQPAQAQPQISSTVQHQNVAWQKEELRKIEEEKEQLKSQQQQIQQQLEEEDCCCICLDDSNKSLQTTICNHKFHGNCLNTWLEKNSTCPLCRAQIVH